MDGPQHAYYRRRVQRLLTSIDEQPVDRAFGLHLVKFIHPTTFYSLGVAAYCSATLGDYIEKMIRYYSVVTTNDVMSLDRDSGDLRCVVLTGSPVTPSHSLRCANGIAAIFVTILRVATQMPSRPAEFLSLGLLAIRIHHAFRREVNPSPPQRHWFLTRSCLISH